MVLAGIGDAESIAALEDLVLAEKSDDVRAFVLQVLDDVYARQGREIDEATIKARFEKAKKDKKLGKPVRPWLDEKKLPELKWVDGGPLGPEWTRYLLYRQARPKEIASDIEARPPAAADRSREQRALRQGRARGVHQGQGKRQGSLLPGHRWPVARWREFFVDSAVLFPFAARQVWGAYEKGTSARPTATFRALEDASLTNTGDDEHRRRGRVGQRRAAR